MSVGNEEEYIVNKKIIIVLVVAAVLAICGYLLFRNQNNRDEYVNPNDSGILEVGIQNDKEDKESNSEKEETEHHSDDPADTSNGSSNPSNSSEEAEIPAGGEAVDAGDGSVNIVMNDDEEAFGE